MRRFSHSGLSMYEQCPYRYKLAHVDRVKVERKESIACFRGSAAHLGIELIYGDVMAGKVPTLDEILEATRQWWMDHFHKDLLIPEGKAEDYLAEAETCVQNYYRAHYPFTEDTTLAIEKRISADLDDRYGIVGYIDRLAQRDGRYEVHDFKSNTSPPRNDHPFSERQLAFYAMGVHAERPDVTSIRLVWHYVFLNQVHTMDYAMDQSQPLREATLRLIERIMADRAYCRKRSGLCRWCEYTEICESAA